VKDSVESPSTIMLLCLLHSHYVNKPPKNMSYKQIMYISHFVHEHDSSPTTLLRASNVIQVSLPRRSYEDASSAKSQRWPRERSEPLPTTALADWYFRLLYETDPRATATWTTMSVYISWLFCEHTLRTRIASFYW